MLSSKDSTGRNTSSIDDRLIGGPILSVVRYRCIEDLNRLFTSVNVLARIYLSFHALCVTLALPRDASRCYKSILFPACRPIT